MFREFFFRIKCELFGLSLLASRKYWKAYGYISFTEARTPREVRILMHGKECAEWEDWQAYIALLILDRMRLAMMVTCERKQSEATDALAVEFAGIKKFTNDMSESAQATDDARALVSDLNEVLANFEAPIEVPGFLKLPRGQRPPSRMSVIGKLSVPSGAL